METFLSILLILGILAGSFLFYYLLFSAFCIQWGFSQASKGYGYYNGDAYYLAVWYTVGYKWGWRRYLRRKEPVVPMTEKNIKRFKMEEYR